MFSLNLLAVIAIIFLVTQNSVECKNFTISPRIVGGDVAFIGQFLYQALLEIQKTKDDVPKFHCCGCLISSDFVLTAASCGVIPKSKNKPYGIYALLGLIDRKNPYDYGHSYEKIFVPQKNIIVHPNFDFNEKSNDIALLRLSKPAKFDGLKLPIRLPSPNIGDLVDKTVYVPGWGSENPRGSSFPQVLLYSVAKVFPKYLCDASLWVYKKLKTSMFCAHPVNKYSVPCIGDVGTPAVYKYKKSAYEYIDYVVGIASWSWGDCPRKRPFVYTRVSSYIQWIKENTKGSNVMFSKS